MKTVVKAVLPPVTGCATKIFGTRSPTKKKEEKEKITSLVTNCSNGKKTKSNCCDDEQNVQADETHEENDDEECTECTPEKETIDTPAKSLRKSALKPPAERIANRAFNCEPSPVPLRRRSIQFASAEELELVKLIPKNSTGTPELTGIIVGSHKWRPTEAEKLAQDCVGMQLSSLGKRERRPPPSRVSLSDSGTLLKKDDEKPRRTSVSFVKTEEAECDEGNKEETTPPTKKSFKKKRRTIRFMVGKGSETKRNDCVGDSVSARCLLST